MAHHSRWATLTAFAVGAAMLVSPALTAVAAPQSSTSKSEKSSLLASVKDQKLADSAADADGKATVFIHVSGTSAAQKVDQLLGDNQQTASASAKKQAAVAGEKSAKAVQSNADQVFASLKKLDKSAQKVYTASYSIPGVAVRASVSALNKLVADNPKAISVQQIHLQVPLKLASSANKSKTTADVTKSTAKPANVNSDQLVGNLKEWKKTGKTGKGVNVAIIDTGLDYTHADFGGAGTTDAYNKAMAKSDSQTPPLQDSELKNLLDSAKFKGGYDFAGKLYGSKVDGSVYETAVPDANPIDGPGGHHGTHVAGTSLGYGVNADGSTMEKTESHYASLTAAQLEDAKIAPGSAPLAGVYALKVFGDNGGSTGLVGEALDWVTKHNTEALASGQSEDLIKVVSMSLGGAYGDADEPENQMVDELSKSGVLSVIAAGNDGDITDITGAPSTASSALTVAATNSGKTRQDAIRINAPASLAGQAAGQYSENLTTDFSVTGKVVALSDPDNLEGCKAYSDADKAAVDGNIVWISWDDNHVTCGSGQRFNMAEQAGAKAVLFASQSNIPEAGIGGNTTIPGFQLSKNSNTSALQAALKAGTLNVTLDNTLKHAQKVDYSGELQDTVANFTSRGSHGSLDGTAKPDVAAPGVGIISASAGSGNKYELMSGTSMATPLTSGVAALVAQAHPQWKPAQLKAQLINTARHDIREQGGTTLESPLRVGTGRIDSPNAVTNQVLVASKDNPTAVNGQFGVVLVPQNGYKATKTFTVSNESDHAADYTVHYKARTETPGVTYSVDKDTLTVPAHGTAEFSVTLSIPDQSALRHTKDTTQSARVAGLKRSYVTDATGVVELDPVVENQAGSTSPLRVSITAAPKPVAQTSHTAALAEDKKSGTVSVSGHGINQGSGDEAYVSKFGVFTLSGSDPAGDYYAHYEGDSGEEAAKYAGTRSLEGVDITRVGYASTAPQLKAAGKDPSKGYMAFAVQTAKPWSRIGNANLVEILYMVGNQGYLTQVTGDNGNSQAPADTAWAETYTYSFSTRRTGRLVDSEPVDDSTISDSNVILARVKLSAFGLTADSSEDDASLDYIVRTYTKSSNGYYTDFSDEYVGNVLKPGIWAEAQAGSTAAAVAAGADKDDAVSDGDASSDPANAEGGQLLFSDQNGQKVVFHREDKDAVPMAVALSQHLDGDQAPDQFDLSSVRTALDDVKDLQEADYTADTWSALQEVVSIAEQALADPTIGIQVTDSDGNVNVYSGQSLLDFLAQQIEIRRDNLVNVSALKKAVDAAAKLQQKDYTASTWTPFASALKAAQDVLADGSATQEQVDKALRDLVAAQNALVSLRGLNAAVDEAGKLQQSDYQPDAWSEFASALAAAKTVQADPNATAKQIEDALVALLNAQAKLNDAKATDFAVLSALVDAATQGDAAPKQGDYTTGSWDAFADALAKAKQDLATKGGSQPASQSEVDADVQALEAARNALVKVVDLKNAVNDADKLDGNAYTSGSFKKLEEAQKAAKAVLADPNASKDDVSKALDALVAAKKALVSLTDLQQALLDASALKQSDYTADSWKALEDALAKAKAVESDPDASADQVAEAAKAVRGAVKALVKAPAKDHSGSDNSGNQGGDSGNQGGSTGNQSGDQGGNAGSAKSGDQGKAGQSGKPAKPGQKSGSKSGSITVLPGKGKGTKGSAAVSGTSLSQTGSNVVLAVVLATLALSAGVSVLAVRRHRDEAAAREPAEK